MARDADGGRPNFQSDLNTGVVYFRNTAGSLAMVGQWRKSMLAQKGRRDLNENVNDQSLFNQVGNRRSVFWVGGWVGRWGGERGCSLLLELLRRIWEVSTNACLWVGGWVGGWGKEAVPTDCPPG